MSKATKAVRLIVVVEYDDEQTDLGTVTEDLMAALLDSGDPYAPESHKVKSVEL